jgi:hypothetical protein
MNKRIILLISSLPLFQALTGSPAQTGREIIPGASASRPVIVSAPPRPPIAPYTMASLSSRVVFVPMTFPVLGTVRFTPNFNTDRGTHRHTGQDLSAPKMRPIVAPFSGVLGFKTETFWIYGDNGFKCLGTHLNDDTPGTNDNSANPDFMFAPNLRPGDRVAEGQLIGYVGNSGDATGPHLHFELFAPDGELVSPIPSLKKARHLTTPRPCATWYSTVAPDYRPAKSEVLVLGCPRAYDPARRILTLLLVARCTGDGIITVATSPQRIAVTLSPADVVALGRGSVLETLPPDRCMGALVPANTPPGRSAPVRKLLVVERVTLPADLPTGDVPQE